MSAPRRPEAPARSEPARPLFVKRRRRIVVSAHTREVAAIFALAFVAYALIGYRTVVVQHVAPFDAVARLAHAYFVWFNAPPKLAAVGFIWAPVSTLVFLPFAAVKPLAVSLAAMPLTSAVFAAGMLATLNSTLALCEMRRAFRYAIVFAFAVNPMVVFYAANGMSEAVSLFFLTVAVHQLLRWFLVRESRFLLIASLAFALGVLSRYELITWALAATAVVTAAMIRQRVARDELEATLVAYLVPIAYGIGVWLFANWLVVGSPFHWLGGQSPGEAAEAAALDAGRRLSVSLPEALGHVVDVNARLFPPMVAVFVGLLVVCVLRRDLMALALAGFLALNAVFTVLLVARTDVLGFLQLRYNMRAMPLAVIGLAWIHLAARPVPRARLAVAAAGVALVAAAVPVTWHTMRTYPYQFEEEAFTRALATGESQEGTTSVGGYRVGFGPEQEMAEYIRANVRGRDAILTDDAIAFPVMLLNGHPEVFLDRIDFGDAFWLDAASAPWGRVRYVLVAVTTREDLLRQRYPGLTTGRQPGFTLVHRNGRWALYAVAPRR